MPRHTASCTLHTTLQLTHSLLIPRTTYYKPPSYLTCILNSVEYIEHSGAYSKYCPSSILVDQRFTATWSAPSWPVGKSSLSSAVWFSLGDWFTLACALPRTAHHILHSPLSPLHITYGGPYATYVHTCYSINYTLHGHHYILEIEN